MARIAIPMLCLLAAGAALSCSGAQTDEDDVAALSVDGPATQSSVGHAAIDGEDDADEADKADDGADGGEDDQDVAVALADVPRLVLDAAQAALPGLVLTRAEIEQENGQTIYCLNGTVDGEEVEVEVSAAGAVLEIERD
jgi:hypothetical protein